MKLYGRLAALSFVALLSQVNALAADPLPRGDPARHGFSPAGLQRIDQFFADEIARDRIPGAVVAIARQGRLVYYKAMGFQDKQNAIPMRTDSIFGLASMTKIMVVVGALTLYEEGRLPLHSPLSNYYPQFASMQVGVLDGNGQMRTEPARRPITIQDLMRHTSGITYGGRGSTPIHKMWPTSSSATAYQMTGAEFMERIAKLPLLYQPGTTWDYSLSTDALGMVVEKVTGRTLGEALRERVWSKVGMPDTFFAVPEEKRRRIAQPLPNDPITGKPQNIRLLRETPKFECGGGCAFATAGDYIRFGQMLMNGGVLDGKRVLSPKTVEHMTSDHLGSNIKNNVAGTEPHRSRTLPRKVSSRRSTLAPATGSLSLSPPSRPRVVRFTWKSKSTLPFSPPALPSSQPPPFATRRMHGLYSGFVSSMITRPPWFQPV